MERRTSDRIADEAGYWDARLRSPGCTDGDRLRFDEWRRKSLTHQESFDRLQLILATLRQNSARADIRALRDAALGAGKSSRKKIIAGAVALGGLAVITTLWTVLPGRAGLRDLAGGAPILMGSPGAVYETGTGQRSISTLQDGSSVELNAQTRIKVVFSNHRRDVDLIYGQALFHVVHDPHRPFIVRAADRDITAVGTQFDVRLDASSVRVTLIEGKVKVSREPSPAATEQAPPPASDAHSSYLSPGQQFIARVGASASTSNIGAAPDILIRDVDVSKVTDWRNGRIFLDDLPLTEAVAEMNRHSPVQISVPDPQLARFHINGMFRAGEQEAFVTALQEYFPIDVRHDGDTQIVLCLRR
jgi:transmembrane sensor